MHNDQDVLSFTTIHSLQLERPARPTSSLDLPTNNWARIDLRAHGHVTRLSLRHGTLLPRLDVVLLHGAWLPANYKLVDASLRWLLDDLDQSRPILGLDAEGGQRSISLIQLATARRCLLIRLPRPDEKNGSQSSPQFSPGFRRLMMDRDILKGGAELWNDVLDVWRSCGRLATNGCVNVTLLHTRSDGNSDSLEEMCNRVIGHDSFRKDRQTTCSHWDAPSLSLRQLVYAAVDAQVSYMLTAMSPSLPRLMHVQDMPAHWLDRAANWHFLRRLEQKEQRQQLEVAFKAVEFGAEVVTIHMKQFSTRVRSQSNVTFRWRDGSSNQMTVRKVEGKRATVSFTGGGDSNSALRRQKHLESIRLDRANEHDLFCRPQREYLSAFMHGVEPPNPFLSTLLRLPFPVYPTLGSDDDELSWWWDTAMRSNNVRFAVHPSFAELNESQRSALRLTDAQRISIIQGPPGTGKTRTIAAEVSRALERTGCTTDPQRVLCLAETNTAARHMCEAIAKLLPPTEVQLLVSREFEHEWHSHFYDDLVDRGYMEQLKQVRDEEKQAPRSQLAVKHQARLLDPSVLVCTIGKCVGASDPKVYQRRATLIIDEASQVHDFKAIIVLRMLPHTERLLLFGDDKQLAPYVAREEAASVLELGNDWIVSSSRRPPMPAPFAVGRAMLNVQYRMPLIIGRMISTTFYEGQLRSHKTHVEESCLRWIHVDGQSQNDGSSCFNSAEMVAVQQQWTRLQKRSYQYEADDIVVVCFYEAQRKHLSTAYPTMRVHNVDSFQGQEAPVILLTLAASYMSAFLKDKRRVNVACSRAKERLYIIGRRDFSRQDKSNCWLQVDRHCKEAEKTTIGGSTFTSASFSPVSPPPPPSACQPLRRAVVPPSHSDVSIALELRALLDEKGAVGMSLIKLGSVMGVRHGGAEFKLLVGCTMKRFLEQRPHLFRLIPAKHHLETWVQSEDL
jgi:hypothetical protein